MSSSGPSGLEQKEIEPIGGATLKDLRVCIRASSLQRRESGVLIMSSVAVRRLGGGIALAGRSSRAPARPRQRGIGVRT